jgi:hypothetical protein
MRRLERSSVRSRFANGAGGSSPDPAQQLAQHNPATTAKDEHRPGLPHQSVYELVKLHIGHIHICCEFHANRAAADLRLP